MSSNTITATSSSTTIPASPETWGAGGFFSVIDLLTDQDTAVTITNGQDGQKIGLRVWGQGTESHQVTFGSNILVGAITGPSGISTASNGECDYLEMMWSDQDEKWWGMSFVPGINHAL